MIQVQHVSKHYGKQSVLNHVTVPIYDRHITGLIGPSGAGKTTLIKCIMGMEHSDTGSISMNNIQVPNRKLLNQIGYMAQSDSLYHDLTGIENIQFFAHMYRRKIAKRRIREILSLVQLEKEQHKLVEHYSGGMKRRLSLAIALINRPQFLILDEPTVGIDPVLKLDIWEQLHVLKEESTILITTHIMDEAMKCDQLLLMKNQGIAVRGTPQQILDNFKVDNIDQVFLKLEEEE
ncbi:ABC transporter ATP-binding protein [Virgibacillus sp. NKC19-3]|uniref:ABC transporter ATP-binding protein n=1 Tax=Virgibacillus saliphilus TaxID=2831674 RepID=UPI001C9A503E|nr:ABC transporter ATP-binding protein [Virgibacillus sp. NKC19-3]MBY7144161.1 ABC transporter ATP-binding protein [Virgibacillus sp. NKC19-3]